MVASHIATEGRWLVEVKFLWKLYINVLNHHISSYYANS